MKVQSGTNKNSVKKGIHTIFVLVAIVMAMAMTSCNKADCNGDLDGMWQLTQWRDKDNVVKATKEDMIFYSFQLQMATFRKKGSGDIFFSYNSMLEVSPDKIRVFEPAIYNGNGHDEIQPMSELAVFGVPEDGIFWVQVLTGSAMELKTNSQEVLTFRKY